MSKFNKTVLLIDAGNTRLKSAVLVNNALQINPALAHSKSAAFTLCKQLLNDHQATILYIASVLDSRFKHSVKEYCASRRIRVFFIKSTAQALSLNNAYQAPEKLGVDRFVAMLGALALGFPSDALIVVDAGTALTIDIVMIKGEHLGGTISPGLQTMFASLHKNTQLDQQSVNEDAAYTRRFYADNTDDAIILGTLNTFIAGIKHAIDQTRKQVSSNVSIILTGGDAEFIAENLEDDCKVCPELILLGLQQIYNHEQLDID